MSLEFLAEMGWKSALVAGAALIAAFLLKSRAAEDRAAMLRLAVGLILLLPLISLAAPALRVENPIAAAPQAVIREIAPVASAEVAATDTVNPPVAAATADEPAFNLWPQVDLQTTLGLLYLAVTALLALRLLGGYATLQRWTWAAREVEDPVWRHALDRARRNADDKRGTRLLLSDSVPAPLSWGWAQPVILIDPETFERPGDADAVLAHEMAHIVRADWLSLMLSRLSVTLFWFNPLVWMLDREMVQQSEEAADSRAVAEVEPAQYAQTLMSCVMHSRSGMVPANSIRPTRNGLSRRIYAVLDGRQRAIRSGSRWTLAAMIGCVAFAAPLAALDLIAPKPPLAPAAPVAPEAPVVDVAVAGHITESESVPPTPPVAPVPPVAPSAHRSHGSLASLAALESLSSLDNLDAKIDAAVNEAVQTALAASKSARVHAMVEADQARGAAAIAISEAGNAQAIAAQARKDARKGLAMGAKDMERGAGDMRRGAQDMRKESERLKDADYRRRQIARAAARGQTVTDAQLVDLIDELADGARDLERSARNMERSARNMRDGH